MPDCTNEAMEEIRRRIEEYEFNKDKSSEKETPTSAIPAVIAATL
jgi:hypothetical protein